ncbi:MAG TPA: hypothetical protein VFF27_02050 [Bacteroidia bacterium]|jgi:hypothetical protein|nr:hypothetical protein [Bacteroidia bacterium]
MKVVSKYRKEYWIRLLIVYLGVAFLMGLCIYFSINNGKLDYQNVLFWIACMMIIAVIYIFINFPAMGLKQVTVDDSGITVNHFLRAKTEFLEYCEIEKITTIRIQEEQGVSMGNGFHQLNMYGPGFLEWNLKIDSERMDSILKPLGWTRETLELLKEKLDDANCIQIESGEPAKIGFKRSGMGMYFFNVFENPIPDSLKADYNDSCRYIIANDRLVLEYGGGAIGSQCFYNME